MSEIRQRCSASPCGYFVFSYLASISRRTIVRPGRETADAGSPDAGLAAKCNIDPKTRGALSGGPRSPTRRQPCRQSLCCYYVLSLLSSVTAYCTYILAANLSHRLNLARPPTDTGAGGSRARPNLMTATAVDQQYGYNGSICAPIGWYSAC